MDLLLLGIVIGLTLFGLAMIASVSVFESYQLTDRLTQSGAMDAPSNSYFLWRSFLHVLIGFVAMFVAILTPYRLWEKLALPLFVVTIGLLLLLFIPGLGNEYGTAQSWLQVFGFSLQPSEFLKLTLIFYLALWLQKRESLIGTFKEGFLPFAALIVLSTFLVAVQPDLGSFLVLGTIASIMFFIAGGNLLHLLVGFSLSGIMGLPMILSQDYVRERFSAFFTLMLHPDNQSIREEGGYQIIQALIAVGSGGPFGVGYGKSIQKFGYLPEVQADMIFSAMAEELGFFRLLIILTMYAILIIRGYQIARQAPDRFGFLLAAGITTWIAIQSILNIAVNLSLFPLTGLTLPFISAGGSSLLAVLIGMGILINISTYSTEGAISERRAQSSHGVRARRKVGGLWRM